MNLLQELSLQDTYTIEVVEQVAKRFRVDPKKLWEMYGDITESNFEQDLCDIAKENEKELKGE